MPSFKSKFFRGGNSSGSENPESPSDYHRYSSEAENDQQQQQQTAVTGALHTQNVGSFQLYTPHNCGRGEQEVISTSSTGRRRVSSVENDKAVENESSGAWWFLSNEGSLLFDDNKPSIQMNDTVGASTSASDYIKKEKILRKKAFNRAVLGGSIRFDNTLSEESSSADLPYLHVHPASSWSMEFPSKQQGQDIPIEWTPQDSSYGAAVTAFGWLPKRIRRLAETIFVILTFATLVYIVIKIGAEISSHAYSSGSGGDLQDLDDDDHYIAHNNRNGDDEDNIGNGRFRFI